MILEAAERHGGVLAIINSDQWLRRKKGAPFMEWGERAAVVSAIRGVVSVVCAHDRDGTVVASLIGAREMYPTHQLIFCNGGDRGEGNTPEQEFCRLHGIELEFGVGGGKTQSSSALVARATKGLSPSP